MSMYTIYPATNEHVVLDDTNVKVLVQDFRFTREVWLACAAVLLYDYLLTLSDEVAYIWRGRWTLARILFCLARYWTLGNVICFQIFLSLSHPSSTICSMLYWWFAYSSAVTHLAVGFILILRIHAIYDCNKKLLWTLVTLFLLSVIAETIFISFVIARMHTAHVSDWIVGCVPVHDSMHTWAYWIPMAFYHGLLFLLVIAKICYLLSQDGRRNMKPGLMTVLLRDSVVSFGGIFASIVLNLVIWTAGRKTLWGAFTETVFVVDAIIGCRLLLNIHETAEPWRSRPWRQEDTAQLSAIWQWAIPEMHDFEPEGGESFSHEYSGTDGSLTYDSVID